MNQERAKKAYNNRVFINSREARTIRILCEYMEPEKRLEEINVLHTVVFFGSSRIRPDGRDDHHTKNYYWVAEELAFKLATWSKRLAKSGDKFYVCTGGGPGIMEAANRGAFRAKEYSIGFNISLPYEQQSNEFVTPELNFEFHYFFMRKLWFLYHAKALIFFPGGFGTLDELFESLTLLQTEKTKKAGIPILLYDREYWEDLINFKKLVDYNLISPEDLNLFYFFSDPDDGFNYLIPRLEKLIETVNLNI